MGIVNEKSAVYYQRGYWNELPGVAARLNRLATGSRQVRWWRRVWECARPKGRFRRALILNCGKGWVERELYDGGMFESALAVDCSEGLLEQARKQRGSREIEYRCADVNQLELDPQSFDLIVNHAAAHHIQMIDRVFRALRRSLEADGVFACWDYVGPHRNQYPKRQWDVVQRYAATLPEKFRNVAPYPHLPTMLATDPTEAIHSDLILETFFRYFECRGIASLGGGLAYPLLTFNEGFFSSPGEEVRELVEKVMDDDLLLSLKGEVPTLFAYFWGTPRSDALDDEGALASWTRAEEERERRAVERGGVYETPPRPHHAGWHLAEGSEVRSVLPETALPPVAVIVLNYNGRSYLDACLTSIERTEYPRESLDVVVVDNASQDGSVDDLSRRFPSVRLLRLEQNLGFAEGNNVGIRSTTAPYVILLNNDTIIEPGSLEPLVRAAESDPTIGACGSKLLFLYDSLPVELEVEGAFVPAHAIAGSPDERVLGVPLAEVALEPARPGASVRFSRGWYPREQGDKGAFRWSSERATFFLPVADHGRAMHATLHFLGRPPGLPPAEARIRVDGQLLATARIESTPVSCRLAIPPELLAKAERRIQNAGQELLPGAHCRDRGSSMVNGEECHALDGSYERQEEVFALCGAAVLLRRRMLDEIGLLDPRFFMYYEDVDLCWRARLAGWRMIYVPDSVVRHVHAGSSVEWSPFFRFHVERNRLFLLVKNAPRELIWREIGTYLSDTARLGKEVLRAAGRAGGVGPLAELRRRVAVIRSLLGSAPHLVRQRRIARRHAKVSNGEILAWTVR